MEPLQNRILFFDDDPELIQNLILYLPEKILEPITIATSWQEVRNEVSKLGLEYQTSHYTQVWHPRELMPAVVLDLIDRRLEVLNRTSLRPDPENTSWRTMLKNKRLVKASNPEVDLRNEGIRNVIEVFSQIRKFEQEVYKYKNPEFNENTFEDELSSTQLSYYIPPISVFICTSKLSESELSTISNLGIVPIVKTGMHFKALESVLGPYIIGNS